VHEFYVRFRFDNSLRNFTIRKFRRSGHKFLCPVLAAISIIVRALALRVPRTCPIGVNNQQLALASYQALPVGRVQTTGERRGAIGDQRSPIA